MCLKPFADSTSEFTATTSQKDPQVPLILTSPHKRRLVYAGLQDQSPLKLLLGPTEALRLHIDWLEANSQTANENAAKDCAGWMSCRAFMG